MAPLKPLETVQGFLQGLAMTLSKEWPWWAQLVGAMLIVLAIYLAYQAGKWHVIDGLDEHGANGNRHGECYADAVMLDKEWNPKSRRFE
jgi:hypothetical protein